MQDPLRGAGDLSLKEKCRASPNVPIIGEVAVPNSLEILRAVIDATPDAIFVKDVGGCYVIVNEAMSRFLGKPAEEIVGKHDLELYPEATARQFMSDDQKVLRAG